MAKRAHEIVILWNEMMSKGERDEEREKNNNMSESTRARS